MSVPSSDRPTGFAVAIVGTPKPGSDGIELMAMLAGMSNGERAVAIHAAGIPADWRTLSRDEIIGLAVVGVGRLGLLEIRRLATRSRELTLQSKVSSEARRELRKMWTSWQMHQVATDFAFHIGSRVNAA